MSELSSSAGKIRSVFERVASGKLTPDNFGSSLLEAANKGLVTKKQIAVVLKTDEASIRKVGNNLKTREIANVARALINQ